MKRNSFYLLASLLCVAGYAWLFFAGSGVAEGDWSPCLFRRICHLPCPACGSTRAVLLLLQGEYAAALRANPLGYLLIVGLGGLPLWLVTDAVRRNASLFRFYQKCDALLKRPVIYLPVAVLLLADWIWNIVKYLS